MDSLVANLKAQRDQLEREAYEASKVLSEAMVKDKVFHICDAARKAASVIKSQRLAIEALEEAKRTTIDATDGGDMIVTIKIDTDKHRMWISSFQKASRQPKETGGISEHQTSNNFHKRQRNDRNIRAKQSR